MKEGPRPIRATKRSPAPNKWPAPCRLPGPAATNGIATIPSNTRAAVRSAAQDGIAYEADRTGVSRHGFNGGDDG